MSLFKKKRDNDLITNCDVSNNDFSVKILGGGCSKCNQLEENTVQALNEMSLDSKIEHVTDYVQIASYGVMTTPALVVNNKVICYGKVLTKSEIISLIKKEVL